MEDDLKARLLKPRLPEDSLEIPGVGMVRVRALTRAEVLRIQPLKHSARERQMLVLGMVEPDLTEQEVAAWGRAASSGELEKVTVAIAKLSGLEVGVAKKAYREFEDDPDADFRLPSGAGTGRDDGGRAESADE